MSHTMLKVSETAVSKSLTEENKYFYFKLQASHSTSIFRHPPEDYEQDARMREQRI